MQAGGACVLESPVPSVLFLSACELLTCCYLSWSFHGPRWPSWVGEKTHRTLEQSSGAQPSQCCEPSLQSLVLC